MISTATTSPNVAALSARPDVALALDAGETPNQARALSMRGQASVSRSATWDLVLPKEDLGFGKQFGRNKLGFRRDVRQRNQLDGGAV